MKTQKITINSIPALVWGEPSRRAYLYVHGKLSSKESAAPFAELAAARGFQTISFDLPGHGERLGGNESCDIWTGIRELSQAGDFVFGNWERVSLFGCSLGAFFSLHAFSNRLFEDCLFQSPVVDMEFLIRRMFLWFSVDEATLREKREIPTPIETLSWDYYTFVKERPITEWRIPTSILYGARDELQSQDVIERFARRFSCRLTIAEKCAHGFWEKDAVPFVERWLRGVIPSRGI